METQQMNSHSFSPFPTEIKISEYYVGKILGWLIHWVMDKIGTLNDVSLIWEKDCPKLSLKKCSLFRWSLERSSIRSSKPLTEHSSLKPSNLSLEPSFQVEDIIQFARTMTLTTRVNPHKSFFVQATLSVHSSHISDRKAEHSSLEQTMGKLERTLFSTRLLEQTDHRSSELDVVCIVELKEKRRFLMITF